MKDRRTPAFDRVLSLIMTIICVIVGIMIIRNFLTPDDGGLSIAREAESSTVNVGIETAARSDLTSYVKLYGDIVTDSDPVALYPDVAGEITSITVKRGDRIEKGEIIGYVNQSKPGYSYQESPIDSPVSGEVLSVDVSAGDTVQTTTSILTVLLDEDLKIDTEVPERYIYALVTGSLSEFTVAAYDGRTYEAELTYISPIVDTETRTAEIELTVTGNDDGLMEGMFASVSLATETAENVITVPSSAINEDNNGKYVLVADNGSASRRSVETGLSDGRRTAVLSGIEEGDSIIISGSASEGSAVSIVEES